MSPLSANKPLMVIDVKPSWVLYLPPYLRGSFNRQRHSILLKPRRKRYQHEMVRAVSQLFAHMHANNVEYGVLTTYHSTYFFKRIDTGHGDQIPRFLVSPIINKTDMGARSLVAAFVGITVIGSRGGLWAPNLGTPGPCFRSLDVSPGTAPQHLVVCDTRTRPFEGFDGRARRVRGGPQLKVQVRFVKFLSRNLASTFRGVLEVGRIRRDVILKVYDLSTPEIAAVCDDELKAYVALTPIQGTHVPKVWAVGTLYGIYRVIAMDHCGDPVPEPPPPEFYEQAPKLFRAIHGLKVVHNDIDLRNFLVSHGHHYWVIDFNSARVGTPEQVDCEARYLKNLLDRMKRGYIVPKPLDRERPGEEGLKDSNIKNEGWGSEEPGDQPKTDDSPYLEGWV
ncbi:hypothetical protein TWF730_001040 [Orbilia blumenaviensis]|uniref:Protein kinase domain-containing protein n=1 Tax=Orbilia blumenaviensis TaxID=1796055 RepID=A0AAV9VNE1_9PEZI